MRRRLFVPPLFLGPNHPAVCGCSCNAGLEDVSNLYRRTVSETIGAAQHVTLWGRLSHSLPLGVFEIKFHTVITEPQGEEDRSTKCSRDQGQDGEWKRNSAMLI